MGALMLLIAFMALVGSAYAYSHWMAWCLHDIKSDGLAFLAAFGPMFAVIFGTMTLAMCVGEG